MKTVLMIADAACDSGFAKATHNTLEYFTDWNRAVLGINYRGDPHKYLYPIYPAARFGAGEDLFGVKRVHEIVAKVKPDVVIIQNDPWNIPRYVEQFDMMRERPVLIGAIAIDGKNCRGTALNGLDHAIFWTDFAEREARLGGFTKPSSIVPLGVDLSIFNPGDGDKIAARRRIGIPEQYLNGFIFLNVNRNQPRKRLDLTMEYFADFYHNHCPNKDAYLYMHVCPTGDIGYDINQLTAYYGLRRHVMLAEPGVFQGSTEEEVADTYRSADVQISTTQGEGWGLTTLEGMACGVPQLFPDWAALGDWARDGGMAVPCTTTACTPNRVNVVGGVPDKGAFVDGLRQLYTSAALRDDYRSRGYQVAGLERYRWEHIGRAFADAVHQAYFSAMEMRAIQT